MRLARFSLLALAIVVAHGAHAAPTLDRVASDRLATLAVGERVVIDRLPGSDGAPTRVTLHRIEIYAPDARIIAIDADGQHDVPRSTRIALVGASDAGDVRVGLSFDPGLRNISGVVTTARETLALRGDNGRDGLTLRSAPLASTYPKGVVPHIEMDDDGVPSGRPEPSALQVAIAQKFSRDVAARTAIVAIDTDNEFMANRFGNSTSAASAWIVDLFASMNVMYQRDLNVTLLEGTTYLRIAPDPYAQNATPANQADLNEFGTYWQNNYGSVQRAFALLLSGKSSSGFSSSGIAWIDAYCQSQAQGGSYAVTQVFTSPQVNVNLSALVTGHELGHNFGAWHTHCTNATSGAAPTNANTIDQCRSGESYTQGSCYSGTERCPTSGPGAPAGTIMSYCNLISCGSDGQNVAIFHPTQVATVSALIAQNTPQCIRTAGDPIFKNGFD